MSNNQSRSRPNNTKPLKLTRSPRVNETKTKNHTVVLSDDELTGLMKVLSSEIKENFVSKILKVGGIIKNTSHIPNARVEKYKVSHEVKNSLGKTIYISTGNNIIIAKITTKPAKTSVSNHIYALGTPSDKITIELNSKYIINSIKQRLSNANNITTILNIGGRTKNNFNDEVRNIMKELPNSNEQAVRKELLVEAKKQIEGEITFKRFIKERGRYQLVYNDDNKSKYIEVKVDYLKNKK